MSNEKILVDKLLSQYAQENNMQNSDKAFEVWASLMYFKNKEIEFGDFEETIIGTKDDLGIDGFFLFVNDGLIKDVEGLGKYGRNPEISLYITQYKNNDSTKEKVIDNFIVIADYLSDLSKKR